MRRKTIPQRSKPSPCDWAIPKPWGIRSLRKTVRFSSSFCARPDRRGPDCGYQPPKLAHWRSLARNDIRGSSESRNPRCLLIFRACWLETIGPAFRDENIALRLKCADNQPVWFWTWRSKEESSPGQIRVGINERRCIISRFDWSVENQNRELVGSVGANHSDCKINFTIPV